MAYRSRRLLTPDHALLENHSRFHEARGANIVVCCGVSWFLIIVAEQEIRLVLRDDELWKQRDSPFNSSVRTPQLEFSSRRTGLAQNARAYRLLRRRADAASGVPGTMFLMMLAALS